MKTDELRERAQRAHAGKLAEAECRQLYHDTCAAIDATKARMASLDYTGGAPGPARAAALARGADGVLDADAEVERLIAELEVLAHVRDQSHRAADAAQAREAVPRAKAAAKALPDSIAALERAHATYERARAETDALVSQLRDARLIAERAGHTAVELSADLFERLAAVTYRITPDRVPGGMAHAERDARTALTGWRPEPRWVNSKDEKLRQGHSWF